MTSLSLTLVLLLFFIWSRDVTAPTTLSSVISKKRLAKALQLNKLLFNPSMQSLWGRFEVNSRKIISNQITYDKELSSKFLYLHVIGQQNENKTGDWSAASRNENKARDWPLTSSLPIGGFGLRATDVGRYVQCRLSFLFINYSLKSSCFPFGQWISKFPNDVWFDMTGLWCVSYYFHKLWIIVNSVEDLGGFIWNRIFLNIFQPFQVNSRK